MDSKARRHSYINKYELTWLLLELGCHQDAAQLLPSNYPSLSPYRLSRVWPLTSLCLLHGLVLAHIRCRTDRVKSVQSGELTQRYSFRPGLTLAECCSTCFADSTCVGMTWITSPVICTLHGPAISCDFITVVPGDDRLAILLSPC